MGKEASRLAGRAPHGHGARRRGRLLVEYFVPTGLDPCPKFLRLNQAPALPCVREYSVPPCAPRGCSVSGYRRCPLLGKECIKGIRERLEARA